MANTNPSCGAISADIYFEITDVDCYTGNAIVNVLEFTCLGSSFPGYSGIGIEVLPMPCMVFEVGLTGWAKLVQSIDGGDCHWRAYSLCCLDAHCE